MSQSTPPPINPYDVPERRGMSGTAKVLLGLGIGCGLLVVLCCGVLGFGSFAIVKMAQDSTSHDPAQIHDIASEIALIQIPDSLKPKLGLNLNVPLVGPVMKGAVFQDDAKRNVLLIGQFNRAFADQAGFEAQLRGSFDELDSEELENPETEVVDVKINGDLAKFTLSKGMGRRSREESWEVIGQFAGATGPALLIFEGRTADFTKEQIIAMLKSME
jgi:hypothetical protein